MTYGQAYLSGWKETFNFSGRASRRQFWTFFLINVLIAAAPVAAWSLATLVDPHYGAPQFCCHILCSAVAAVDGAPLAGCWLPANA
ncbi:Predicted membrane protein [Klebsiella pneumoniae]|uniref:Predicted membrane protein n=1 Tax=Klebsiella pneumoniae TaxID=573 RepID=A0A377UUH1_KLEPN|nr:Predicted membrane protein [Klebsiella pneumoniae]